MLGYLTQAGLPRKTARQAMKITLRPSLTLYQWVLGFKPRSLEALQRAHSTQRSCHDCRHLRVSIG
jgi:hypothetical protein